MSIRLHTKPLISVLLATYQREDFIIEAIESVINQTYQNWELIIVDDGSTDNTRQLISNFIYNEKIHYYYQENAGQASALNHASTYAIGEYIAFVDSDNRWLPKRLELGLEAFRKKPNTIVAYANIIEIDMNGTETSRQNMPRHSGNITAKLLCDNFVSFNTALVKAEAFKQIDGFNGKMRRAPDYDLWLRTSTLGNFFFIPEFLAEYRVMEDQISSDKEARFENNLGTLLRFKHDFPEAVSKRDWNKGFSLFHSRKSRYHTFKREQLKAVSEALKSIRYDFICLGSWKSLVRAFTHKGMQ